MRVPVLAMGFAACLALAAVPAPRLMWNATASVPVGLYRLQPVATPEVGDLVVVRPSPALAEFLAAGGWLPRGVPLLKPVAAVAGSRVCRDGLAVSVDGRRVASALSHDGHGRPLPRWTGCRRLEGGEVFLLAPAPASLDGRYFGVTARDELLAGARPLWTPDKEAGR